MSAPVLLPAAARVARPWKNGGGTTREVLAFPAGSGMDDFAWRISMADVTAPGPFSAFPGIDRHLLVLSGRMALAHDRGAERIVGVHDPACSFPGDVPAIGRPIGGAVRDLNLMVRRATHAGSLRRHAAGPFAGDADVTVVVAPDRATVTTGGFDLRLEPLDAILLSGAASLRSDRPFIVAEITRLRRGRSMA